MGDKVERGEPGLRAADARQLARWAAHLGLSPASALQLLRPTLQGGVLLALRVPPGWYAIIEQPWEPGLALRTVELGFPASGRGEAVRRLRLPACVQRLKLLEGQLDALYLEAAPGLREIEVAAGLKLRALHLQDAPQLYRLACASAGLHTLTLTGAARLRELHCAGNPLRDLALSALPLLRTLDCSETELAELVLPADARLQTLNCARARLHRLDLSGAIDLTQLDCGGNALSQLDLSGAPELRRLDCRENRLDALDLRPLIRLTHADAQHNPLTRLHLPRDAPLEALTCNDNQLTRLRLGRQPKLQSLICSRNPLERLQLRGAMALQTLHCGQSAIRRLDVSMLRGLKELRCTGAALQKLLVNDTTAEATVRIDAQVQIRRPRPRPAQAPASDPAPHAPRPFEPTPRNVGRRVRHGRIEAPGSVSLYGLDGPDALQLLHWAEQLGWPPERVLGELQSTVCRYGPKRWNRLRYRTRAGRIRDLVIDLQVLPIRDWQWQPGFEPRRLALIPAAVDRGGLPPLPASLEVLICEYRVTRKLSLRALPRLRELHCRRSRITELDLAGAPKLSVLDCAENQLTTLDLRHSPELWSLDCSRNRLSTLDLSQAPSLRRLDCTRNQLATLDLSQSRLSYLDCRRNQLTRLEIPASLEDVQASLYHSLARMLIALGRPGVAEALLRESLKRREGRLDPQRIQPQLALADVLADVLALLCENSELEALVGELTNALEATRSRFDSQTLRARSRRIQVMLELGDMERALAMQQALVAEVEAWGWGSSPDLVRLLHDQGHMFMRARRDQNAIDTYRREVAVRQAIGDHEPRAVVWAAGVPLIIAETRARYREVLAGLDAYRSVVAERLGPDAPQMFNADLMQLKSLWKLGEFGAAIEFGRKAVAEAERRFDADHRMVLNMRAVYAQALGASGQAAEGLVLMSTTRTSLESVLGPNEPSLLVALSQEAVLLAALGRLVEAQTLLAEARSRIRADRIAGSWVTLRLAASINRPLAQFGAVVQKATIPHELDVAEAHILRVAGDLDGALAMARSAFAGLTGACGDEHTLSVDAARELTRILELRDDVEEAAAIHARFPLLAHTPQPLP